MFNLCKRYETADGTVTALDGVTLRVKKGEFIAVIGESGSGKTTLLGIIGGMEIPDSGRILLDGRELTGLSQNKLALLRRREIGIVHQAFNLIPELDVLDNILLPVALDGGAVDEAWLSEILGIVGLRGREHSYPAMLSGGQQQRVAIARALFFRPSLILADEPTGNLDRRNSEEILKLLKEMNRSYGITVIIVTHSDMVAEAAERVITLADGRVVADRRRE